MRWKMVMMLGGLAVAAGLVASLRTPGQSSPAPSKLTGGAASVEALADALLEALHQGDEAALQRLRVNEDEYRTIIAPGTVAPGQPLRRVSLEATGFFWRLLATRSGDYARILLRDFGGKPWQREEIVFTKGRQPYATYTALGELRLTVRAPDGTSAVVRTGTVAEVGGSHKLIGFNWDD